MRSSLLRIRLLLLCLFAPAPVVGQSIVTPDRLVSNGGAEWPLVEPHLAVNDADSDHLLAASRIAESSRTRDHTGRIDIGPEDSAIREADEE